jgi:F0F1-type ATP synthase membrane subunit b/b'
VADLEKEIAALRASMRQDAEREQARLLEGAQERAKRIQDEMRFQLDQQVKEAELLCAPRLPAPRSSWPRNWCASR